MDDKEIKKKQSGKITRADGISFVGKLVYVGLFFLGLSLTMASVASFLLTALCLAGILGIQAGLKAIKRVEKHFGVWRWVEIFAVALTLAIFIVFVNRPIYTTLSVFFEHKEDIKSSAILDLATITSRLDNYKRNTASIIDNNYKEWEQLRLSDYGKFKRTEDQLCIKKRLYKQEKVDLENYKKNVLLEIYLGNKFETEYRTANERVSEIKERLSNWDITDIWQITRNDGNISVQMLYREVADSLNAISNQNRSDDHRKFMISYEKVSNAEYRLKDDDEVQLLSFKNDDGHFERLLKSLEKGLPGIFSLLFVLFLNLWMFLSYLTTNRSTKVQIRRRFASYNIGGVELPKIE